MVVVYPAIFHHESNCYWVEFPDLDGCQTYGDTIEEALFNAKEALAGYVVTLISSKIALPQSSDISSITVPDKDAFTTLVDAKCADVTAVPKKSREKYQDYLEAINNG